jgi:hypothetical protein
MIPTPNTKILVLYILFRVLYTKLCTFKLCYCCCFLPSKNLVEKSVANHSRNSLSKPNPKRSDHHHVDTGQRAAWILLIAIWMLSRLPLRTLLGYWFHWNCGLHVRTRTAPDYKTCCSCFITDWQRHLVSKRKWQPRFVSGVRLPTSFVCSISRLLTLNIRFKTSLILQTPCLQWNAFKRINKSLL